MCLQPVAGYAHDFAAYLCRIPLWMLGCVRSYSIAVFQCWNGRTDVYLALCRHCYRWSRVLVMSEVGHEIGQHRINIVCSEMTLHKPCLLSVTLRLSQFGPTNRGCDVVRTCPMPRRCKRYGLRSRPWWLPLKMIKIKAHV